MDGCSVEAATLNCKDTSASAGDECCEPMRATALLPLGLQDALGVEAFSRSEQAFAAEDLFNAYQSADAGAIRKCISSKPIFLDLDNQVHSCLVPLQPTFHGPHILLSEPWAASCLQDNITQVAGCAGGTPCKAAAPGGRTGSSGCVRGQELHIEYR